MLSASLNKTLSSVLLNIQDIGEGGGGGWEREREREREGGGVVV